MATQTHAEVITKVALAALDTEGESSSAEEENEDDIDESIQKTVDIWLIDADPKKRDCKTYVRVLAGFGKENKSYM